MGKSRAFKDIENRVMRNLSTAKSWDKDGGGQLRAEYLDTLYSNMTHLLRYLAKSKKAERIDHLTVLQLLDATDNAELEIMMAERKAKKVRAKSANAKRTTKRKAA